MSNSRHLTVFFYVQHLLGIGHLRRAELLCRSFSNAGWRVTLAMGGQFSGPLDVGGAKIVNLPALKIGDADFHQLVDDDGLAVDDAWKAARKDELCAAYAQAAPDILITEAFPFGRRQMRFELDPLLSLAHSAKHRPLIVCSVRDILKSERKPGRAEETVETIAEYYDLVLVHGDPGFARLEETFPLASEIAEKIRYTGIVAPPRTASRRIERSGVLVSAGGGAVGEALFQAALEARAMSRLSDRLWRLLLGPNVVAAAFEEFRRAAPDGVVVERYRDDFRSLLSACEVSVSQAGYNTVADILTADTQAVLVAFDDGDENEQPRRARMLAERGRVQSLTMSALTPEHLAAAIDLASLQDKPCLEFDLDGAANATEILAAAAAGDS